MAIIALLCPLKTDAQELDNQAEQIQHQLVDEYEKEKAIQELSDFLTLKAEKLVGKNQGQCVIAVRKFLGVSRDEIQGMAKSLKVNSQEAEVGSIIKLGMSKYGHVGVVLDVTETEIIYFDSNGDWKQRGAIRKINIDSTKIKGYRVIENLDIPLP